MTSLYEDADGLLDTEDYLDMIDEARAAVAALEARYNAAADKFRAHVTARMIVPFPILVGATRARQGTDPNVITVTLVRNPHNEHVIVVAKVYRDDDRIEVPDPRIALIGEVIQEHRAKRANPDWAPRSDAEARVNELATGMADASLQDPDSDAEAEDETDRMRTFARMFEPFKTAIPIGTFYPLPRKRPRRVIIDDDYEGGSSAEEDVPLSRRPGGRRRNNPAPPRPRTSGSFVYGTGRSDTSGPSAYGVGSY